MPPEITQEIRIRTQQHDNAGKLAAEHIWLLVAAISGTFAAATWATAAAHAVDERLAATLRLLCAIAVIGYLVRSAESRLRRLVIRNLVTADRARREGYATGFVDGTARRLPDEAVHLRAIN